LVRGWVVGHPDAIERAEGVLDRWIKAMGAVLGEEIVRVTNATTLRSDQPRIWGGQRTVTCPGRIRLDDAREGVPGQYEDGPPVNIRVGMLTIGTTAIGSVNAKFTPVSDSASKPNRPSRTRS
jgi:neutral ceramidase